MKNFFFKLFGIRKAKPDRFLGVLGNGNETDSTVEFEEAVGTATAAATTLELIETPIQGWRSFLHQYQYSSSACVAFTIAKIAQILYFIRTGRKIRFSPGWIYRQRENFPQGGMWIDDVIKLASAGMITEELYPSEYLTEDQINSLPDVPYGEDVAEAFAVDPKWVNLPINFDVIAKSIKKTEKGIMMWVDFGAGEFFYRGIPITLNVRQEYRHSITGVDAIKYKGVDYIVIEDSAEKESDSEFAGRKLISRDWLLKHCFLARYPIRFKFEPDQAEKPSYDGSIASLQDCLTYEGTFPSNITNRGVYGQITVQAVKDFQRKYAIVFSGTPETAGYGKVGPKTRSKLLELYP